MRHVSRRSFLKTGSAAVVAAGAISAFPGLPAVVDAVETQGPADTGAAESRRLRSRCLVGRRTAGRPRSGPGHR